jgi:hypothetical protein
VSDTESLPAQCAKCGGAVTLFLTVWSHDEPARTQTWKCPHCHEATSSAQLPGKVGWIFARQRDSPNQKHR